MSERLLLLNLDAEEELARARLSLPARAPSAATRAAIARAAVRLAPHVPPGTALAVLDERRRLVEVAPAARAASAEPRALVARRARPNEPPPAESPAIEPPSTESSSAASRPAEPRIASAWCPTPGARAALADAGFAPPAAPPPGVLAAANDRATFADLAPLPGSAVLRSLGEAVEHLARRPAGEASILRRGLSAAGRGARRVAGGAPLAPGDRAWLEASLALGAVTLDPRVAIALELAVHGDLDPGGACVLGSPCVQEVDRFGQWVASRRLAPAELAPQVAEHLVRAAESVAARLAELGYFGPFGVDAYLWRGGRGELSLRAPSEVNARYTMGWWTGMGLAPPGAPTP